MQDNSIDIVDTYLTEGERPRGHRVRRPSGRPRAIHVAGAACLAAACVAAALVLLLPAGAGAAPSVSSVAQLAARGPSSPPPAANPRDPVDWLDQRVGRARFPNWSLRFGLTAVGQRIDRVAGRRVVTVYYQRGRAPAIAYTLVGGPALARPTARVDRAGALELRVLSVAGRLVVSFRRDRHTCVLSGMGVTAPELERLASASR